MLAVTWGSLITSARADGDPASDVLTTQRLFLPQGAGVSARQQAQLVALLQEAARSGYPIRVALIASAVDLGSVGALWGQPESYARFLGQELVLVYRGPLLVVMPAGVGVNGVAPAYAASLRGVSPRGRLGVVALVAVERLAAAAGHQLPLPNVAAAPARATSNNAASWIVFAAGALIVVAAWTASLRDRPIGLLGRRAGLH